MTALSFAIGQRLTADLLTDFLALTPVVYTKASTTNRNSGGTGTTYTIDPELQGIALDVGTYEIELVGYFTLSTTTTQKIKTQWRFATGTWNSPVRACSGPGSGNTAAPDAFTTGTSQGYVTDSQDAIYDTSTSASYTIFREYVPNAIVTVSGTLGLYWAQVASSANNTSLKGGTSFRVRKLNV